MSATSTRFNDNYGRCVRTEWTDEKGQFHREGGPAIDFINGTKAWYIHGKRHRQDGPAVTWQSGAEEYWVDGVQISRADYQEMSFRYEYYYGIIWKDWKGRQHRLDGPAAEWHDGLLVWYKHGEMHRLDGPAIIRPDGTIEWLVEGIYVERSNPVLNTIIGEAILKHISACVDMASAINVE